MHGHHWGIPKAQTKIQEVQVPNPSLHQKREPWASEDRSAREGFINVLS
jgi:hypothetical protein